MTAMMLALIPRSWFIGFSMAVIVTLVVVALVVPVIVLAFSIGKEAVMIDGALQQAVKNTAPLPNLRLTIDNAEVIVDGLYRGRKRLGG